MPHDDFSNSIMHYGIKGMKWGVRKKYDTHNRNYTDKQRKNRREQRKKIAKKAVENISKAATTIGSTYVYDQIFRGGMGTRVVTKLAKDTISVGSRFARAATQAYWDTHPRYTV